MGVQDRDWFREPQRGSYSLGGLGLRVLVIGLGALLVAGVALHALGTRRPTFAGEHLHGTWKAYLADEGTCPGGERTDLPLPQQAETMVCLVNFARRQHGLQPLAIVSLLDDSSVAKAERVVRCHTFAHDACGEDPAADARAAGYTGDFGENLYIADGRFGAPRAALDGWLNSPGHRENLFKAE